MEDTAKAIAVENKWLFYEIDSSEIILKFMQGIWHFLLNKLITKIKGELTGEPIKIQNIF
jgi:hypothetical protein